MAIEKSSSRKRGVGKKVLLAVVLLGWLGATGFLTYSYFDTRKDKQVLSAQVEKTQQELETFKTNPEQAAKQEVKRYVEEVGKVYSLPAGEEPSVATVSDKEKLKDQPFFAKAENGDITLIYTNAKLAVLYRPSTKKIINVSSVTIDNSQSTTTP